MNRATFTDEQIQFMKDKLDMPKYRTAKGKVRVRRLRDAFETEFHVHRPKSSIAYQAHHLLHGPYPSELARQKEGYKKRVKKDGTPRKYGNQWSKKRTTGSMTLSEVESRLEKALESVKALKDFVS